jgi:hypothetical protein
MNGDFLLYVLKDFLDLRTKRNFLMGNSDISDEFQGFPAPTVECLTLLDINRMGDTSRLTFGCTCGQCVEEFLSLRMKLALLDQAGTLYNFLSDEINDVEKNSEVGMLYKSAVRLRKGIVGF